MNRLQVIQSIKPPKNLNVLWLDTESNVLHKYDTQGWTPIQSAKYIIHCTGNAPDEGLIKLWDDLKVERFRDPEDISKLNALLPFVKVILPNGECVSPSYIPYSVVRYHASITNSGHFFWGFCLAAKNYIIVTSNRNHKHILLTNAVQNYYELINGDSKPFIVEGNITQEMLHNFNFAIKPHFFTWISHLNDGSTIPFSSREVINKRDVTIEGEFIKYNNKRADIIIILNKDTHTPTTVKVELTESDNSVPTQNISIVSGPSILCFCTSEIESAVPVVEHPLSSISKVETAFYSGGSPTPYQRYKIFDDLYDDPHYEVYFYLRGDKFNMGPYPYMITYNSSSGEVSFNPTTNYNAIERQQYYTSGIPNDNNYEVYNELDSVYAGNNVIFVKTMITERLPTSIQYWIRGFTKTFQQRYLYCKSLPKEQVRAHIREVLPNASICYNFINDADENVQMRIGVTKIENNYYIEVSYYIQ